MPSIAGKYQHYKNENVDDYFTAVGVPYMGRKMMSMSSPVMEITLEGDTMTIKNSSLLRTVEYKFKLGEEYVENMPNTSIKVCSLDGWMFVALSRHSSTAERTLMKFATGIENNLEQHISLIPGEFTFIVGQNYPCESRSYC